MQNTPHPRNHCEKRCQYSLHILPLKSFNLNLHGSCSNGSNNSCKANVKGVEEEQRFTRQLQILIWVNCLRNEFQSIHRRGYNCGKTRCGIPVVAVQKSNISCQSIQIFQKRSDSHMTKRT